MIYRSRIKGLPILSSKSTTKIVDENLLEQEISRVRHAHSTEAALFESAQYQKERNDRRVDGVDDAIGEGSGDRTLIGTSKPVKRLLLWCRAVCAASKLRVPIFNFTTSFADGRALCAILNFYHPS